MACSNIECITVYQGLYMLLSLKYQSGVRFGGEKAQNNNYLIHLEYWRR